MADWRPIKGPHSIETVAAVVAFSEPLSSTLMRRALRAADGIAASVGLANREEMQTFAVNLSFSGGVINQPPPVPAGVQFQRLAITHDDAGNPMTTAALNFVVTPGNLQLVETNYVRWANFKEDVRSSMTNVLRDVLIGTRVRDVRLEYRDRFVFEGNLAESDPKKLLKEGSRWIAPHVFDSDGPWHSHTGRLDPAEHSAQRLTQISIDANDGQFVQNGVLVNARSISIMTGLQDIALIGDPDQEQSPEDVLSCFGPLHDDSKALFRELITNEMAIRVGLDRRDGQ